MLKRALKAAVVLASSAVVIPYAVALIANMVCGWPVQRDRYRRALNPWKVYALNYAILLELTKVRFLGLFYRWQRFYNSASKDILIKNIPFGSNDNFLDIYLPRKQDGCVEPKDRPVIIFLYGGTWGSGDKNMYGLLCSHLADKLQAVVICPNYSIFPKGFVDDMVQDVGEAIKWVKQHVHSFGGSKKKIVLMGHSAGAHLAVLTLLELCIKQLVHDEDSLLLSSEEIAEASAKGNSLELSFVGLSSSSVFHFEEQYFNGDEGRKSARKNLFPGARPAVAENGQGDANGGEVLESFYFVEKPENPENHGDGPADATFPEDPLDAEHHSQAEELATEDPDHEEAAKMVSENEGGLQEAENPEAKELTAAEAEKTQLTEDEDDNDLLSSIKLIIGLAGVYDIVDHFEYESQRGVEDVSTMARAMYDPRHFPQFSPTILAKALPSNIRLPHFHLLHGDSDYVVPFSSSVRFGEALWDRGIRGVEVVILPGCSHYDICLDLMDAGRQWHNSLMTELRRSISSNVV